MNEPKIYKEYVTITEELNGISIDVKPIETDDDYEALKEIIKYCESQAYKPYSYYLSFKTDQYLIFSLILFVAVSIFNMFMLNLTGSYFYLFFNVLNGGFAIYNFYLNDKNKQLNYQIRRHFYLKILIEVRNKILERYL